MAERERFDNGTFAPKSSQVREVRSLRLTDKTWKALGDAAELKGITRADLIEELATSGAIEEWASGCDEMEELDELEELKKMVDEFIAEKERMSRQLSTVQKGLGFDEIQDLRNKVLRSLGVGQQSKVYMNVSHTFKKFIRTHFPM